MSVQFGTIFESRASSARPVASNASGPGARLPLDHHAARPTRGSVSIPGPTDVDPPTLTYHFAPFEQHLNALAEIPRWFKHLDDYLAHVFSETVLSHRLTDAMVARTLQIVDNPTLTKMHGLALAVCTHWMRMQCHCKDAHAYAQDVVAFVARIVDRLGRAAQADFVDALNELCVEKLKSTWRWYVSLVGHGVSPMSRKNLFMRVMTVVAITSYLFRGGILRYGAALDVLGYIATMSPWLDAVAVIYAFLHELGPNFTRVQAGWDFVQQLLAELFPLTVRRVHSDPLYQLVSAINALVSEWHRGTQVALYHTHPKENNTFHGACQ